MLLGSRSFTFLLLLGLTFQSVQARTAPIPRLIDGPLPTEFSTTAWRQMYLEIAADLHLVPVKISPMPHPGTPQERFIKYFKRKIQPKIFEIEEWSGAYHGLKLLLESGLYADEIEREKLNRELQEILEKWGALQADPEYKSMILEYGRLAGDLKGSFAESARNSAEAIKLNSFPPERSAEVIELYQLEEDIDQIANNLPSKDLALRKDKEINELIHGFHKGQVPFLKAAKELERLSLEGDSAVGAELVRLAGDKLIRVSQLRSQLAQSKGFKTWAEYSVATQARAHGEGLKTSKQILDFLYSLLEETKDIARLAFETGAKQRGVQFEGLRPAAQGLLVPQADFHLYGYFPMENTEGLWRKTMVESGFPETLTRRVIIDAFPREKKQGHAYMMPARTASLMKPRVNGRTLEIQVPSSDVANAWSLPVTSIVQNFTDDDVDNVRTMFHEGGHGLDYAAQRLEREFPSAYGYSETHSTFMEGFLEDREFLLANAKMRDGATPPPEVVDRYLSDRMIANLIQFRGTVAQAIFDIELWDYDYSQKDAKPLWQRAIDLNKKIRPLARFLPLPEVLVEPIGLSYFRTSHYYSGSVAYFGYVLAEVSASMLLDHTLDLLEGKSGRRSLYQQPELAGMLLPIYRDGSRTTFPQSIEKATGQKFLAREFATGLGERVKHILNQSQCEGFLSEKDEAN